VSTAASLVRAVTTAAAREGADVDALLAKAELDRTLFEDRDARVPTRSFLAALDAGIALTKNPSFGAKVACAMDGAAFGVIGFVVGSCATLRDALQRFGRYTRLLCDELRIDVLEQGDVASIVYVIEGVPHSPALFEMAMVHLVLTAQKGTRDAFRPRSLVFRHASDARALSAIVRAPVESGVQDAVLCDRAALDLPLRGRNPTLLGILDKHVEQVLAALPEEADLVSSARTAVRGLLPLGEPSLGDVARRCGLGERTLQRRLRERGVTFRTLIDDVRREVAEAQLARPNVAVAEVAFALGFSSPSAFHHAYRRWTGKSPGGRA
jgi:AraC-like DNA-binding protein